MSVRYFHLARGDFVSSHVAGEHRLVILLEYIRWERFSGWSVFFVLFEYSFLNTEQKGDGWETLTLKTIDKDRGNWSQNLIQNAEVRLNL